MDVKECEVEVRHFLAMLCGEGMYVVLCVRQGTGSIYLTESITILPIYLVSILTKITT